MMRHRRTSKVPIFNTVSTSRLTISWYVVTLLPKYVLRFFDRGSAWSISSQSNLDLCGVWLKYSLKYLSDDAFVIMIIVSLVRAPAVSLSNSPLFKMNALLEASVA